VPSGTWVQCRAGSAVRDEGYWLIDAVDEPINKNTRVNGGD